MSDMYSSAQEPGPTAKKTLSISARCPLLTSSTFKVRPLVPDCHLEQVALVYLERLSIYVKNHLPLTFAVFRYLKLPAARHVEFKESRSHPNDRSPSCVLELLSQVENHIETLATDPHGMRREDLTLERFISGTLLRTFILPIYYLTGSISSNALTTIRSTSSLR